MGPLLSGVFFGAPLTEGSSVLGTYENGLWVLLKLLGAMRGHEHEIALLIALLISTHEPSSSVRPKARR